MTKNTEREWIDADNLREVIGRWDVLLADDDHEDMHGMLDDLRALFPAPQPRTLADMTPEEREACQWMQADFDDGAVERPVRVVITKAGKSTADIILPEGDAHWVHVDKLTPLPDLPRMVWPEEQATEETLDAPRPEDVPEEEAWIVECYGDLHVGTRDSQESPHWALARMDGTDVTFAGDHLVTLVSRLVPEATA